MPELRWTLLLLGALFIAVLAWAERRKARQSPRAPHEPTISDAPPPTSRVHREPAAHELPLPEMRARDLSLPQDLPVVHVEDDSPGGLSIEGDLPPAPQDGVADLPVLEAAEEAEVD